MINRKSLDPFRDIRGALVQRDQDGGDSAYRTALLICLLHLDGLPNLAKSELTLLKHNCYYGFGLWRRHWDLKKWYSHPNNFSRDQWQKVFLALVLTKDYKNVFKMLAAQVLRLGFHQNIHKGTDCEKLKCYKVPDLIGISQIIILLRAFPIFWTLVFFAATGATWFSLLAYYAFLHVIDLSYFADLYFRKKQPWDYDSLMCVELMFSVTHVPTLTSLMAKDYYKKTDFNVRIQHNYCATENDICPLGIYYNETAHKIFNKPKKG